MISLTRLFYKKEKPYDSIRYGKKASGDPRPVVVLNSTRRCNLSCKHCYINANKNSTGELSTEDCIKIIDQISDFKAPVIIFSGGEPLIRNDLFHLGQYAVSKNLRAVISSNGTLIDKTAAQNIKDAGFSYVGISLDGLEACNNFFRGNDSAFIDTLNGIRNLKVKAVRVGLRFTITRSNHREIGKIFPLMYEEGIDRVCFYHLVPSGRADSVREELLDPLVTRQVMEEIIDKTGYYTSKYDLEVLTVDNHADGPFFYLKMLEKNRDQAEIIYEMLKQNGGNKSGEKICSIDPEGNVHPDQFMMHYNPGNIHREEFSAIWSNPGRGILEKMRTREKYIHGRCASCRFYEICRGNLRARSEALTGDIWASDPACYLTDEEISV